MLPSQGIPSFDSKTVKKERMSLVWLWQSLHLWE